MSDSRDNYDWDATKYSEGSYIQHTFSDQLIEELTISHTGNWLDIGCGDGRYTLKLSNSFQHESILGIDSSSSMIAFAKKIKAPNVSFEKRDISTPLTFDRTFSIATAFWSLQWVEDLNNAALNIFNALQKDGQFTAILPCSQNGLFLQVFRKLKKRDQFPEIRDVPEPPARLPSSYQTAFELAGFSNVNAQLRAFKTELPTLDFFYNFVQGIKFYEGKVSQSDISKINHAMTDIFQEYCQEKHNGKLIFDDHAIVIKAVK